MLRNDGYPNALTTIYHFGTKRQGISSQVSIAMELRDELTTSWKASRYVHYLITTQMFCEPKSIIHSVLRGILLPWVEPVTSIISVCSSYQRRKCTRKTYDKTLLFQLNTARTFLKRGSPIIGGRPAEGEFIKL